MPETTLKLKQFQIGQGREISEIGKTSRKGSTMSKFYTPETNDY